MQMPVLGTTTTTLADATMTDDDDDECTVTSAGLTVSLDLNDTDAVGHVEGIVVLGEVNVGLLLAVRADQSVDLGKMCGGTTDVRDMWQVPRLLHPKQKTIGSF